MTVELAQHQLKAIEELRNGSILKGGVGVGKSRTAIAYYYLKECQGSLRINGRGSTGEMATPKDIFVITTAKKRNDADWVGEAAPFRVSTSRDASLGSVKLTVDSWNNINAYEGVSNAFFIFDEQRLVGSGAWVKAFYKIAANNRWILLSATPGDNWMDYVPVFVANGFYKNRTEFIRRHVVYRPFTKFPQIDRYVETSALVKLRKQISVEMPYTRHTIRHVRTITVSHDKAAFDRVVKDRWNVFEDRPLKDVSELFSVMRKLVNSDVSRLGAVMQLWEQHPKLIIFYNFNYELDMLRVLCGSLGAPYAEWNGHKHQEIPKTDKWIYLVQYTAGAEGWNCVDTDATVFWSLNYSYRINEQAKGRIDRMNTLFTDLHYYIFRSNSAIDTAIAKSLVTKKNFNEKEFIGGKW